MKEEVRRITPRDAVCLECSRMLYRLLRAEDDEKPATATRTLKRERATKGTSMEEKYERHMSEFHGMVR